VEIVAADVEIGGTINATNGAGIADGDINIYASRNDSPIQIQNTASGGLNLSLLDLLSMRPNAGRTVTIGETGHSGTVFIGGLGTVGLGLIDGNYTLNGGAIDFNGGISLHDDATLTLNAQLTGTITATGTNVTDVTIGGTGGTLILDALGNVTLNTRVTNLGEQHQWRTHPEQHEYRPYSDRKRGHFDCKHHCGHGDIRRGSGRYFLELQWCGRGYDHYSRWDRT
jgi:hypothetical protein